VGGGDGRRTAFESAHTLRQHATELFVRKIARELAPLLTREPTAKLVLVAGPEMLGELRGHLDLAGESRLEWPHNLANLPTSDLRRRLSQAVAELRQTAD
jgi:protein required for attachment to host cells